MNQKLSNLFEAETAEVSSEGQKKSEISTNLDSGASALVSFKNLLIILLAFFIPFAFLPIFSFPYFEMSKFLILFISVFLMIVLYVINAVSTGVMTIRYNKLTPFIVFLVISYLITLYYTGDKTNALYGGHLLPITGTIGFFTLIMLYFVMLDSGIKSQLKHILNAFLVGQVIATVLFLASYFFNKYIPIEGIKAFAFTTSGTSASMAVLSSVAAVLALIMILRSEKIISKIVYAVFFILTASVVIIINTLAGWVGLAVAVLFVLLRFEKTLFKKSFEYISASVILAVAIGVISFMPVTQKALGISAFPRTLSISATESWSIMLDEFKQPRFFLFGYGPSQYLPIYTSFKPSTVLSTEYWNQRFSRPYNEVFYQVASVGVVGVGLMALIGFLVISNIMKKPSVVNKDKLTLSAVILALSIPLLFANANTTWVTTLVILFSLYSVVAYNTLDIDIKLSTLNPLNYLVPLAIIVIFSVLSYGTYIVYASEYYYTLGVKNLNTGDTQKGADYIVKSANIFATRDAYHRNLASLNLFAANNVNSSTELEESAKLQALIGNINQAINEADAATKLWPQNANNWETLGDVQFSAAQLANDKNSPEVVANYVQGALNSMSVVEALDPKNPTVKVAIGNVYLAIGDNQNALTFFTAAANLKQDYAQARFSRGLALEALKSYVLARDEYTITKNILTSQGVSDVSAVDAKLKVISPMADEQLKQQQEAQAQAAQEAQAANGQQQAEDPNFQAIPEPQTVTKPSNTEPAIETTPATVNVPAIKETTN
jgi:tetratricopeptide (TPR) repeat protein